MKGLMEYQGYFGTVEYNDEDQVFFGRLAFLRSLVSYEGTDVKSLRKAFQEAVDDYLELCRQRGKEPDHPFRGTFNVRTGSDLHRRAVLAAQRRGMNLNRFVTEALEKHLAAIQRD